MEKPTAMPVVQPVTVFPFVIMVHAVQAMTGGDEEGREEGLGMS
jgi:hypothetical protein